MIVHTYSQKELTEDTTGASVDQVGELLGDVETVQSRSLVFHRCEDAVEASVCFFVIEKIL